MYSSRIQEALTLSVYRRNVDLIAQNWQQLRKEDLYLEYVSAVYNTDVQQSKAYYKIKKEKNLTKYGIEYLF